MKKFLSVFLVLCLVFTGIMFSGCGTTETVLNGGPIYEDNVYGNGGLVVAKGEYVYFASGYVDTDDLGDTFSNIKGTVTNGGLYRAKMANITTGEGDDAVTTQGLVNKELMVSKIVGFEDGGLYIFKDKIYFASPSIVQDSTGVRYDLTTFFSCNLDGSGLTEFYQTDEWGTGATFSMTMINTKIYLLVYTGAKIIKVEENKTIAEMASDVTDVALPTKTNILNIEENPVSNECFIYYTKDTESENSIDLGNALYKKDIISNTETELFKENYIEIDLLKINAGRLFYTRNSKYSDSQSFYSNSLEGDVFANSETRHTMNAYSSPVSLGEKNGTNLGVAFIFNDTIYLKGIDQGINELTEIVSATSITVASGGYIYYVYSSDFYRVDITSTEHPSKNISGDLIPFTSYFDIDSSFCYFFVADTTTDSGYVLYRMALDSIGVTGAVAQQIG